MTAWQWLKLEWYWAVPAFVFGTALLGICLRILKNRRRETLVVDDQETAREEVTFDDNQQEETATGLDAITIHVDARVPPEEVKDQALESNGKVIDDSAALRAARDQRIRAEIEALHKARVEQRQLIEARNTSRPVDDYRRSEERGRLAPKPASSVVTTVFPDFSENSRESRNGLYGGSVPVSTNSRSQNDSAEDYHFITNLFDDPSPDVRNVAARALYHLHTDRAASFTRALREASPERRRRIAAALASSGLATEALSNLAAQNLDKTYDAFSVLFLMAKAGEVQSLIQAIEDGPNLGARLAVVKLLALSGQAEVVSAFRRLAVRSSLPPEVRSAVMEAIHQIRTQA